MEYDFKNAPIQEWNYQAMINAVSALKEIANLQESTTVKLSYIREVFDGFKWRGHAADSYYNTLDKFCNKMSNNEKISLQSGEILDESQAIIFLADMLMKNVEKMQQADSDIHSTITEMFNKSR